MKYRVIYPAEMIEKIRSLYGIGYTVDEVAVAIGSTHKIVTRVMKRHGIVARNRAWRPRLPTGSHTSNRDWYRQRRLETVTAMGGKCVRCAFDNPRALQIDHIKGGGNTERMKGQSNSVAFYKRAIEQNGVNYQLLCANCNAIKRWENNEIPKRRRSINETAVWEVRSLHPDWTLAQIGRELGITGVSVRRHLLKRAS